MKKTGRWLLAGLRIKQQDMLGSLRHRREHAVRYGDHGNATLHRLLHTIDHGFHIRGLADHKQHPPAVQTRFQFQNSGTFVSS